ncbi:MAG: PilZ domain-containing protein [Bdellovibrionaceae bacterium]|nr:PilZ domain-containing protein [Pseudobdellovibrionaceae bacterium]
MNQPKGTPRSVSPRYPTRETAHIEIFGQLGHIMGNLKNVSKTGALVELPDSTRALTHGDVVHMTIHLFSLKKTHIVHAEVIWNSGSSVGLQFVKKDQILEKMFSKTNSR